MRYICFAILSTGALASTIYTTNDANDTSNVCGTALLYNCTQANAWAVGPSSGDIPAVAETFTPAATGVVGEVDVPVAAISGTGALKVEILTNGAGNIPGTVLESWTDTSLSNTVSVLTLASVVHPTLAAGTKYWIEVTTTGTLDANWYISPDLNLRGADIFIGSWVSSAASTKAAVDVLSQTAAPEPSTAIFAAMGVAFFLIRGLRRR